MGGSAVKRNTERFPEDFMFQLTPGRSRTFKVAICDLERRSRHNNKYLSFAFTEHGAIQSANVLNSPRAVEMGIYVARLREAARSAQLQPGARPALCATGNAAG